MIATWVAVIINMRKEEHLKWDARQWVSRYLGCHTQHVQSGGLGLRAWDATLLSSF
jgi:hypothetical protein